MFAARLLVPAVALLFLGAAMARTAIAGSPASTPPAHTPAAGATTNASAGPAQANKAVPQRSTGVVKTVDIPHRRVVVTMNGADQTFTFANLAHAPDVRVGAHVDVIYTGDTANVITLHM